MVMLIRKLNRESFFVDDINAISLGSAHLKSPTGKGSICQSKTRVSSSVIQAIHPSIWTWFHSILLVQLRYLLTICAVFVFAVFGQGSERVAKWTVSVWECLVSVWSWGCCYLYQKGSLWSIQMTRPITCIMNSCLEGTSIFMYRFAYCMFVFKDAKNALPEILTAQTVNELKAQLNATVLTIIYCTTCSYCDNIRVTSSFCKVPRTSPAFINTL